MLEVRLSLFGYYTLIYQGKTNKSFIQLKQTPKFTSVYLTELSRIFPHVLHKTGTILFLMNAKNNNLRTTSIETVTNTIF